MRIGITGATGQVGHWIAAHLLDRGHAVVTLGRNPSRLSAPHRTFALDGPPPDLSGIDALVHAAFSHVPGRYRGGEGDDPDRFVRLNREGTLRLFEAARTQGVRRVLFLSSRAVYGGWPPGTPLNEALPPRPDALYGQVKLDAEEALAALPGIEGTSLRATGVYGPPVAGMPHKWDGLLDAFHAGARVAPRAGTELHADDLAAAVALLLTLPPGRMPAVVCLSDILLDRRDLLAHYARIAGLRRPLPPAAASVPNAMRTDRIAALGWRPRGCQGLDPVLRALAVARISANG
ncbi:NAD-dependent epimerase/dehydratase family protein [Citreimonas salinaria]|uniref:Nucleoside-diphosphate-sugar epimerase n=1 Tax=Citreimonas salinaria TaxID=321339 RepID=A0A1H3LDD4_9RHOB|nr:NAD(P)-dependent oxidoreductase [Citreimonas salinaria]SDY61885.1 Nucleoside-diphosphate-sugar epimerase [Citreimonas salinaria]